MNLKYIDTFKIVEKSLYMLLSYFVTVFSLVYMTFAIIAFNGSSNLSIIGSSFLIGIYIFVCNISNCKYDDFIVKPESFNFLKFIKIVFIVPFLLSIVIKFTYPEFLNILFLENIFYTVIETIRIFFNQNTDFLIILPLILGIFAYSIINFFLHWYLIIIWNIFLFQFEVINKVVVSN